MMHMKYLDAILRYFSENDFTHKEDVAIIVSDLFNEKPDMSLEDFITTIGRVRRDFFRINKINRVEFAEEVFAILNKVKLEYPNKKTNFEQARNFISENLEIGFDPRKHIEHRNNLIGILSAISEPHSTAMKAFNNFLSKIAVSHQLDIHGVKEFSGVDISKSIGNAVIGFQLKAQSDDISENMIRAECSKAQEWGLDGFVLVYARKSNKVVETSIQAAYHYFRRVNESEKMYCAIITPSLLAELFRKMEISFE
jgi:hypothetical protein